MRLSIRWRLTLWNTLAVALALLGFGALQYGLLARALYQRLDRNLREQYDGLQAGRKARLDHWVEEFWEHEKTFCVVYRPDGSVRARTSVLNARSLPPAPEDVEGVGFGDADLPMIGRQRLLAGPLELGGVEHAVVLFASLEEADRELGRLRVVLLTAGPIALLGAGGLGYLLARKALAPMERLNRLTGEITADRLDRRLPVSHAGDELGRLAQTINGVLARLERSFAEIRRFTADASHELRTPLAVIRSEAEVALRRPPGEVDYQQLLASILEECQRLTRMTDQLLTLSREDTGAARQLLEPLDLGRLVLDVADALRPLAEVKGVSLHCRGGGPLPIRGDGARLRQVFINVLDNAIKYTPRGGSIEVAWEVRGDEAAVIIRDTGAGIPPEHLPHVFDRFYRVDRARSRAEGGAGLGLSIARSIVAAHGGSIGLASTPGKGTTCTITLPRDAPG